MSPRESFLQAASAARTLLASPELGAAWESPSALAHYSVGDLAGHLARQILGVSPLLVEPVPSSAAISILEHYRRSSWVDADPDAEVHLGIRRDAATTAAVGQHQLVAQLQEALTSLPRALAAEPVDRVVHLAWVGWSLTLDDFLVTRTMEIAVHRDDLGASLGVPIQGLPEDVLEPVYSLLARLAARRYGSAAVLRAFTRSERAPETLTVF